MLEKEIETLILDYMTRVRKIKAWKNPSIALFDPKAGGFRRINKHSLRGVADILFMYPMSGFGITVYFEVKTIQGRLSDAQKAFRDECAKNRVFYFVVRSLDDVYEVLDHLNCFRGCGIFPEVLILQK